MKIYHGIIEFQHLIDPRRVGLLREWYAESKMGRLLYCCNQAWMKNGGLFLWNAFAICEVSTPTEAKDDAKEKPPKGFMWSGEILAKIQATTRPENFWPEVWSKMGKKE